LRADAALRGMEGNALRMIACAGGDYAALAGGGLCDALVWTEGSGSVSRMRTVHPNSHEGLHGRETMCRDKCRDGDERVH
jgi:hypothetical protein